MTALGRSRNEGHRHLCALLFQRGLGPVALGLMVSTCYLLLRGLPGAWQGIAMYGALGIGAPIGLALMAGAGFAGLAVATIVLAAISAALLLPLRRYQAPSAR